MPLRKKLLRESKIYALLDQETLGKKSALEVAAKIKSCGINIIQLRDKKSGKQTVLKEAHELEKLLNGSKTLFIVNDYLEIAKIVNADGIHLGQYDSSIETARRILGKEKIIGVSCHNLKQAIKAQKEGADYISFGPIFKTPLKPAAGAIGFKLLKEINKKIKIPCFVIGGIDKNNIDTAVSCGAKRVAACRAICKSNNITQTLKILSETITYPRPREHAGSRINSHSNLRSLTFRKLRAH